MYTKTNKKVEIRNGTKTYIRTVYLNEFGSEFFKDGGKWRNIYKRNNADGYNAPYYNGVRYI